jgi:leukotriene-A4 hydrolase
MRTAALALAWLAGPAASAAAVPDPHSYADPSSYVVRHAALDLEADFAARRLRGAVDLTVERMAPRADRLVLDTRDLEIRRVALVDADGALASLGHRLAPADELLGRALEIRMPEPPAGVTRQVVRIEYSTGPEAAALQWLEPRQDAGRSQPFLYTQSQSIRARSWIPIQDSPGIRFTYEARIRTPPALRALMSAAADPRPAPAGEHRFVMPQPVPAYLVALAVGDLEFRALGPRTGVYAEPAALADAAHEFASLETLVATAERLAGPYRWERYDLLIMPPSFPFGGMENPRLSFISPTVIAGDRSLVSLIAHELAHSWSGNLATNATWGDFWLNEGITTYLERRIVEDAFGRRRADMERVLGRQYLETEYAAFVAAGRHADTVLALDLAGRDPDDALNDIAYEKGNAFMEFLESRLGRPALDRHLVRYFDDFAFRSVTTPQFEAGLRAGPLAARPGVVSDAELREWLHEPGWPASMPAVHAEEFVVVERLRDEWLAGRIPTTRLPVGEWSPQAWMRFLDTLPDDLPDARLAELEAHGAFGRSRNHEITRSWLLLALRNGHRAADARLEEFLVGTGRFKMVQALYAELARTPQGRELGCRIYARARPGYHPAIRDLVDALLPDCARS